MFFLSALSDATSTWSGVLPQRSTSRIVNYSNKVFLGGIPPDITDQMFYEIFKQFGQIRYKLKYSCLELHFHLSDKIIGCRVEWPGKEHQTSKPKGYAYIIFESEKQVRSLLSACTVQEGGGSNGSHARKYFYKISGKYLKTQKVSARYDELFHF